MTKFDVNWHNGNLFSLSLSLSDSHTATRSQPRRRTRREYEMEKQSNGKRGEQRCYSRSSLIYRIQPPTSQKHAISHQAWTKGSKVIGIDKAERRITCAGSRPGPPGAAGRPDVCWTGGRRERRARRKHPAPHREDDGATERAGRRGKEDKH